MCADYAHDSFANTVQNRHMDVDWFKARKRELKLNDTTIGEAIGRDRSIANRLVNGTLPFDVKYVEGLARSFQVSREEILRRAGVLETAAAEEIEPNGIPFKMEGPSTERMRDDLPIYGTALGAAREIDGEAIEQTTLNRAEVVHYAKRPVLLNGRASAYGLYVSGSSMEPRHRDGEIILADPKARLHSGDDVVVYLRPMNPDEDDGESARAVLVKRLVRRTSGYVELEQYQPAKIFRIDMDEIVRVDRVIPLSELLG